MFNGSGGNQGNVDKDFINVGCLAWTPFGPYPYSQAALDIPDSPKLAFGMAGANLPGLEPGEREKLGTGNGDFGLLKKPRAVLIGLTGNGGQNAMETFHYFRMARQN
jgi:hypothetical protein